MGSKLRLRFVTGFFFILLAVTMAVASSAHAQTKDVTLALDWMINGTHSPYYVALDKGYYKNAGFNVEIVRGYGSGDTVKKVAAKRATFGICDFATLVTSVIREKTPDKAVAAVYGKAMLGILYTEESGIKGPKDIEGRKLARSASGASVNMFPAFIGANQIDRSKIAEVVVDATSFLPLLLSGQVDAVLEQSIHRGRFQKAAEEGGQKVTIMSMLYSDFGLKTYGNVISAHNDLIEKEPKMVKDFVQASLKGLAYAFEHPEEAVSVIAKRNPQITKDRALEELLAVKATWSDAMLKAGLGYMSPEMTEISVNNIVKALSLQKPESIDIVYDNRFAK
ncbi:MAG: ABC transporter substrate-binding protein [Proteobacteria bacterium]|nr:ABC transporter substrate-binding protein [Pseudomonadota bacterium]